MIFEHFAINVHDAQAFTAWYSAHLGLRVRIAQEKKPFTTFLEDSSGRVIWEVYQRNDANCLPFSTQHPLTFHVAFVTDNAHADLARLVEAGASHVETMSKPDGSQLIMLRDPWGMPLQLCQRSEPF